MLLGPAEKDETVDPPVYTVADKSDATYIETLQPDPDRDSERVSWTQVYHAAVKAGRSDDRYSGAIGKRSCLLFQKDHSKSAVSILEDSDKMWEQLRRRLRSRDPPIQATSSDTSYIRVSLARKKSDDEEYEDDEEPLTQSSTDDFARIKKEMRFFFIDILQNTVFLGTECCRFWVLLSFASGQSNTASRLAGSLAKLQEMLEPPVKSPIRQTLIAKILF